MENNFSEIEKICSATKKISETANDKILKTPGTMNLAEIMNRQHLENKHSDIIAFLLNPNEKHHHPEYGTKFLEMLRENGLHIKGNKIVSVKREDSTDEARRMDFLLTTDENEAIIIENKIYADDQPDQILDYVKFVEKEFGTTKNIFVVYLTLFGKEPTEISLSKEQLARLKVDNRFINLSYSKGILSWLSQLGTRPDERELFGAVVQYIDVVKGLTNQRKEILNMNEEISKELFEEYGKSRRAELREKLEMIHAFENNIALTLFINFFIDVYNEANEKASGKVHLFCDGKFDYVNIDDWEKDVVKNPKNFGVRYDDEKRNQKADIFVRDLDSRKTVFAVVAENENDDLASDLVAEGWGNPVPLDGYNGAVESSWVAKVLFAADDWEKNHNKNYSSHIVKNWFGI